MKYHILLQCMFIYTIVVVSMVIVSSSSSLSSPAALDMERTDNVTMSNSNNNNTNNNNTKNDDLLNTLIHDTSQSVNPIDHITLSNIATLITAALNDPLTPPAMKEIKRKANDYAHDFNHLIRHLDKTFVVTGLANIWKTIHTIENKMEQYDGHPTKVLFAIQQQYKELLEPHMYDEEVIEDYSIEDQQDMLDNMRKMLYLKFITYAAAGGYIQ